MQPKFQTLSRRLLIARPNSSPAEVLNTILLGVVQHLGPTVIGHAKAVARVDGGIVHASTTGIPPVVEVKTVDNPVAITDRLQLDLLCVFHGITHKTLLRAWEEGCALLTREGFQLSVVATTSPSEKPRSVLSQTRLGIALSLFPSFVVLKPCCLIPVLGSVFGGSFGILHVFAPLESYRPLFMVVSVGLLGSAFYRLYLRPPPFIVTDNAHSIFTSHILFWLASTLFVIAALAPVLFPHTF
jgi:hypothetical protein